MIGDPHTSGSQGTVSSVKLRHFSGKLRFQFRFRISDPRDVISQKKKNIITATYIAAKRSAHDVANSSHAQTWTAGRQSACNPIDRGCEHQSSVTLGMGWDGRREGWREDGVRSRIRVVWHSREKKNTFTDLERKCYVRGIRPTVLLPVQPGRRLARMARVEGDEVVRRRQAGVLELCREPGRVEELRVEEEDGRFGWIEAAYGARRRIGDIPKRGVVVVCVREVDVWHFFFPSPLLFVVVP